MANDTYDKKNIPQMNTNIDAEEIAKIIMNFTDGRAETNQLRVWLRDLSKNGCWCSGAVRSHSVLCLELRKYFGIKEGF